MVVAEVLKMVKENEIKFVDFRFTDTKGKEQHVSVPVKAFGEEKFTEGHAFDGSTIAGWKGIEASDMILCQTLTRLLSIPFTMNPHWCCPATLLSHQPGKVTTAIHVHLGGARKHI